MYFPVDNRFLRSSFAQEVFPVGGALVPALYRPATWSRIGRDRSVVVPVELPSYVATPRRNGSGRLPFQPVIQRSAWRILRAFRFAVDHQREMWSGFAEFLK